MDSVASKEDVEKVNILITNSVNKEDLLHIHSRLKDKSDNTWVNEISVKLDKVKESLSN